MGKKKHIDSLANYMSDSQLSLIGSLMPDPEQQSESQRLSRARSIWLSMPDDLKRYSRRPFRPFRGVTLRSRYPDPNLLMFIIGNHWQGERRGWNWDGQLSEQTFSVLQGGHALTALVICREIKAGRLPRN